MSKLSLYFLGAPRLELEKAPISIGHKKGIALLAYLAVTGRGHARESLADFLWPTYEPASALGEVRRMLYALNKALGKGWLAADRQTIALPSQPNLWVDVNHFRHLFNCWTEHDHPANQVCPACFDPVTEAVALFQDEFLAGFTLPDSLAFDDWQAAETQLLRQELAGALKKLIQLLLHDPEPAPWQAIPQAERLLSLDPLHEPAHRLLMALYAMTHQPAAAFQQYQQCVQVLRDELDVPPDAATTTLYEQIRLGEFEPATGFGDLPDYTGPPIIVGARPRHNLPRQVTPFVGREFELTALAGILLDPKLSLVSIVAPGGMGKTRLAVELGNKVAAHFKNGVFFVELAPIDSSDHIIPAVAEAIGYQFQQSGRSQRQQVLDYLANKQMLLILDNFDHLIENGGEIVTEMLKSGARIKILVTSRQRLYQSGETLFTLHGLRLPDLTVPDDPSRSAAVGLFLQTARRARPDFVLTSENLAHVVQICLLVQGMPLGILLSAPWITVLSPAEIAAEIQRGIDILAAEGSELPERQRSMRAVFDQAWNMMTAAEQQVFMKLAVFRGGFTRQAGQAVTEVSLRQLQSLVNKVLVEKDLDLDRYQIHELLRQYAAEKLHQSGQYSQVCHEHTHYYLSYLAKQTASLKDVNQLTALKLIENDFENIRVSWGNAVAKREYGLLGGALEPMYLFCFLWSRLEDGKALFDQARQGLAPEPDQAPHPVWLALGIRFYSAREDRPVLQACLESALSLARSRDDPLEAAYCLDTLATIAYADTNPFQAIALYEECAAIYRRLDEKYYLARTLSKLSEAHKMIGQGHLTRQYINEAYQLQREIGDQIGESESLRALGMLAYVTGQYDAMNDFLEKAYTIRLRTNYLVGQAASNLFRGSTIFRRGEAVAGREYINKALDLALDVVDYSIQAQCFATLSWIDSAHGHYAAAEHWLRQAEAIEKDPLRQTGISDPIVQLKINFARALLASGKGDDEAARRYLRQLLQAAITIGSKPHLILFLPLAAILFVRGNRQQRAAELLGLTLSQPIQVTGWMSQWVLLNQVRDELQAELGPTVFAAAWAHGESLDLKTTVEKVLRDIETKIKG